MRVPLALPLLAFIGCSEPSEPNPGYLVLGSSSRTVTVAWPPVDGATSYIIERGTSESDLAPIATLPASAQGFLDTGLEPHTSYAYRFTIAAAGGDTVEPIAHATTTDDEPLVSGAPTPIGDAIVQTIGASGGTITVPAMQATVTVPAGAVPDGTAVTVQPIASPYPDDDSPAVMFSTTAEPSQPISVGFAYDELDDPDNLAVAVQQDDGSWVSQPRTVDATAKTVAISIDSTPTPSGRAFSAPIKFHDAVLLRITEITPHTATVKAHDTLALTPEGVFSDDPCEDPDGGAACHAAVLFFVLEGGISIADFKRPAHRSRHPLANQAPGWDRAWTVERVVGGSGEVGTVLESGTIGATYTAPGAKPASNPVAVRFESVETKTGRKVTPRPSLISIHDPGSVRVTMNYRNLSSSVCGTSAFTDATDRVTFAITLDDQLQYHVEAIHNEPTIIGDIRSEFPVVVTSAPEVFTMTSGMVLDDPDQTALVAVYGTLTTGGCTFPSDNGATTFPDQTFDTGVGFSIVNNPNLGLIVIDPPPNWTVTAELVED